jgi:hypothetical protein
MSVLDVVRTQAHRSITSPTGDGLLPVRVSKDLLRRANSLLGKPLCSAEELEKRRAAATRLENLRADRARGNLASAARPRVQAPVTIYFQKDRNVRELRRIEELLAAKGIDARRLDVADDEATLDFVLRTAHVQADELPVVFVTDKPIGGYTRLVDADVSGRLEREVFPNA